MTFADQIIQFNLGLHFEGVLPAGIRMMNPFRENPEIVPIMQQFYKKFYDDKQPRQLILGINPGRLGAGATGVPFTDTKRMAEKCGIDIPGFKTHEPSSVFIYDVIDAYGGLKKFYKQFYIGSVCPLGFTALKAGGKEVNYNYYDSAALIKAADKFIIASLRQQLKWNISREVCYLMGTGKNAVFFQALNAREKFFKEVVPLEHPRFVMQYKSKTKEDYIDKYLAAFTAHH
ncbi:uracil-DNA glycosylase family protein [Chitinophaga sp. MM2321]|uniref:uracil-DNA glycosylase family protein n=1 Tax=Chitinophaga sp. MM2321 TaxID=3137178 RepID=UPI0032D5AE84